MIVHRIALRCLLIFALVSVLAGDAHAHGGVVEEDDLCVIKVSYLRAHFKIYQPRATGHKQFCEDLPVAEESIFVMEYQHDALSRMLVDFRIIHDVTGKGRFARIEDVEKIGDIDSATVYYRAPMLEPDVYTVNHTFTQEGDFIGIVSARDPETGRSYAAVFPFEVGFTGLGYWPFIVVLVLLMQLQYLVMSGKLKRWLPWQSAATAAVMLLLVTPLPASDLQVTYSTPDGTPVINRMHSWILHIEDAAGKAVEGASIEVTGGMPEHDHGLPTAPRVTEELGGGDYRLDGMRFHMRGDWQIEIRVTTDGGVSTVFLPIKL